MRKTTISLAFLLFAVYQTVSAANINIIISGFAYSPSSTSATVGDVVTIQASSFHPLVQVDQPTWNANGATPMSGGWGTQTANYTFTVTTVADIYYVCANHVGSGMKGMITVTAAGVNQVIASAHGVSLYPNPVTGGEFTVKMEGYSTTDAKVLIYNEAGQVLESHNLTSMTTVIRTKLPAAQYFYAVISAGQQVQRSKFVIAGK